jgi:hypothetical protein
MLVNPNLNYTESIFIYAIRLSNGIFTGSSCSFTLPLSTRPWIGDYTCSNPSISRPPLSEQQYPGLSKSKLYRKYFHICPLDYIYARITRATLHLKGQANRSYPSRCMSTFISFARGSCFIYLLTYTGVKHNFIRSRTNPTSAIPIVNGILVAPSLVFCEIYFDIFMHAVSIIKLTHSLDSSVAKYIYVEKLSIFLDGEHNSLYARLS